MAVSFAWSPAQVRAHPAQATLPAQSQIVALAGGRFVVVWFDEGGTEDIKAQVLNGDGSQFGSVISVNTNTVNLQLQPAITALAGGGFAIAWTNNVGDSQGAGIAARVFSATGSPVSAEFLVNADEPGTVESEEAGTQSLPAIAALGNGGFVVSWTDNNGILPEGGIGVRARHFSSTGAPDGNQFLINTTVTSTQSDSEMAVLGNGNYVVVFTDESATGTDTSAAGIKARIFTAAGAEAVAEFTVNSTLNDAQVDAEVAALAGGGFVVTWRDFSDGNGSFSTDVRGRIFNNDGTPVGDDFLVHPDPAGGYSDGTVAGLKDGRFIAVWAIGGDIFARVFNANGSEAIAPFVIHETSVNNQLSPDISVLPDGRVVISWVDQNPNAGTTEGGVITRILDFRTPGQLVNGTGGDDHLGGTQGFGDTINGLGGNDFLYGGGGNDSLNGGAGNDDMTGGTGNDTYYVDSLADIVREAAGAENGTQDTVITTVNFRLDTTTTAQGVEHLVATGTANVTLVGSATYNIVTGNSGNNYLAGYGGNDTISGGAGDDLMFGGEGKDTMTGGLGNDRFYYNFIAESGGTQPRRDVITDFGQTALTNDDWIDLAATDANGALAGNQAFTWLGTGAFTGAAGELRYFQDVANNRTIIEGNVRVTADSPGPELSIELTGLYTLTAGANNTFDIIL